MCGVSLTTFRKQRLPLCKLRMNLLIQLNTLNKKSVDLVQNVRIFRQQLSKGIGITLLFSLFQKTHLFVHLGQLIFQRETRIEPFQLLLFLVVF